ncbi:MAG: aminoacetone oxidase family FAD-binding enzyme [Campylobacterota bacterium]|nr:aminoacetone oxidase family FAD-binding enzyme [Campylobacterota bacterium]
MNEEIEIAIIGAGASGLMVASLLQQDNAILIEGNSKVGAKILVSGGGKCNITNAEVEAEHYLGNVHVVNEVLKQFDQHDLLQWLESRNMHPVLRKNQQYFCPKSSSELLGILKRESKHQTLLLNEKVMEVRKMGDFFMVLTAKKNIRVKRLVVASGGLSFSLLGADDIGYKIAESFGHTINKVAPALVGLTVQKEQFFFKELSGIATEVLITVGDKKCKGSLLFAHKGISGPAVLDASLYWEKGKIVIDFLPGWSVEDHLQSKKQISSLLPLPKRVSKAFLEHLEVKDRTLAQLSKAEIEKLLTLKHYSFAPAGTFGYSKAEVTKGGVATDEIDTKTMMSRKVEGLYFVGEVLDMTGRLGGYNFQWAFSSAYVCAKALSPVR